MSFIVKQAGGVSSTGYERILDMPPENLHQRVPVILGSKNEVEVVLEYHKDCPKNASQLIETTRALRGALVVLV